MGNIYREIEKNIMDLHNVHPIYFSLFKVNLNHELNRV